MTDVDEARVRAQLRSWRESLIDLSRANPLLGINRARTSRLRAISPSANDLFDMLVVEGKELRLPLAQSRPIRSAGGETDPPEQWELVLAGDVSFDVAPEDLARRLRRIRNNARTTVEERGVTTLHLTLGALHWMDNRLGESVAPLYLVPCVIETNGPDKPMRLSASDEEPQLNPALAFYLSREFKIQLPELPDDLQRGTLGSCLSELRASLGAKWSVSDDVWLSTFSFETLTMYQDLVAMEEAALDHPVVRGLAGASVDDRASESLGEDLDALPIPKVVPLTVLPTDSDQLRALALARNGRHVLVHGPPGTGKSQTITNLILDTLEQGKTVLFVSAKMAALEVVFNRLKELGFERFCLEAHSVKAGKRRVAEELKRALEAAALDGSTDVETMLDRYRRLRVELNRAVRELHMLREPLGLPIYTGIGRRARLDRLPALQFPLPWDDPTRVTREQLDEAEELVRDLQAQAGVFAERDSHPWRGFTGPDGSVQTQEEICRDLGVVRNASSTVLEAEATLAPYLGLIKSRSLRDLMEASNSLTALGEATALPRGWTRSSPSSLQATADVLANALALVETYYTAQLVLAEQLAEQSEAKDPSSAFALLSPALHRFGRWWQRLQPGYLAWRRDIAARLRPRRNDFSSLRTLAQVVSQAVEAHSTLEKLWPVLQAGLGRAGKRLRTLESLLDGRTALTVAEKAFRHAATLSSQREAWHTESAAASKEPVHAGPEVQAAAKAVLSTLAAFNLKHSVENLDRAWSGCFVGKLATVEVPIGTLAARCDEVLKAPDRLAEWVRLRDTIRQCEESGLGPFVEALDSHGSTEAVATFQRRFWLLWSDTHLARIPSLRNFSGLSREGQVQQFKALDGELREAARMTAAAAASSRAAKVNAADYATSDSQLGILRRELQKKRHRPLRKLFADIPQVLQAIKPCLLMSPVSVSTYLTPGTIMFDLVIFDEASQIPPQESIPSILRARQVVVAGDDNQLPPMSFFSSSVFAEEEEEAEELDVQPLESLWRNCAQAKGLFEPAELRWHYRSRDERLIEFSNYAFYDGRLHTFPAPEKRADRGVQLRYVPNGVWDRGRSKTNRIEAREVVKAIVEQLGDHPERSLGVVALNVTQKEAIEDALELELNDRPDLRERLAGFDQEPFFIKSLENVQGDERDTIIISTGYGPDSQGVVHLNFGPLNHEGGWRRLNVLVTRARELTLLVTSLRSDRLSAVSPANRGATALRQFLEYAESGGRWVEGGTRLTNAETNEFEEAVAAALRSRGFTVDEQVGASTYRIDMAVRDPRDQNRYVLGIECDGATYHSSRSARDRDLLRAEVLRGMGWRLWRIWSTDWFRDPTGTLERTIEAIERALTHGPPGSGVPAPLGGGGTGQLGGFVLSQASASPKAEPHWRFPPGEPYALASPLSPGDPSVLTNENANDMLIRQVGEIVEVEGPIHLEVLIERLKLLNGVQRAGSRIRDNVWRALSRMQMRGEAEIEKDFVRLPDQVPGRFRTPSGPESRRPLEYVHRDEIRLAVLYVVEREFGLPKDSLCRAVAREFGFERTTADLIHWLSAEIDDLIERGELRLSGLNVTLA